MVWNSHGFRGSCRDGRRLRPDRSVGPNVYSLTGPIAPDWITSTPFLRPSDAVPLIPHLGGDIVLPSCLAHTAGLVDGMSQRFLTVDVFAQAHSHQTSGSMGVIGRADGDRINFRMHFFKHFAEIFVFFCFWETLTLASR